MSSNDNNNVRNVLRPVEDFIARSHTEFNDAIHKVLLPSLMNSSFALHSLKESLNDGIYEYGEQRFRDGVRSAESGESRIQLDVVQPSSSPSPSPSPRRLEGVSGLSERSENVKHVKREELELEPENDGKSQIIHTLTAKLMASQKRINELQTIINKKEQENNVNAASAAKCVQLWKENGELLEKCETTAREVDALKAENDELKKERSKVKVLVVEAEEDEEEVKEPTSDEEGEEEEEVEVEEESASDGESEAEEEEGESEAASDADSEEEEEEEEEEPASDAESEEGEEVEEEEEGGEAPTKLVASGGQPAPHAESDDDEEEDEEEEEEDEDENEDEDEDEDQDEEEEEAEVEEYEYHGKTYYIMSKESGPVYECLSDGDIGEEIGKIVKGAVYLKGPSVKGKQVWVKA
jgi:hypothetical protein